MRPIKCILIYVLWSHAYVGGQNWDVYPLHGSDWECKDFLSITWLVALVIPCQISHSQLMLHFYIPLYYLPFQLYLAIKFNHLIGKFELSEVLKSPTFWHHIWKVKCGHFNSGIKLNMCRNWWVGSRHLPVTFWRVGLEILRDWSSPILQVLLNYMESKVESCTKICKLFVIIYAWLPHIITCYWIGAQHYWN